VQRSRGRATATSSTGHTVGVATYASHLALHADPDVAVDVAADHIEAEFAGVAPTLIVALASNHFRDEADAVRRAILRRFPMADVVGAVIAGGVIGRAEEVELHPAISLWAAALPEGAATVLEFDDASDLPDGPGVLVLLADPFSLPAEELLERADTTGLEVVGGFTGGMMPGAARLIAPAGIRTHGAVGISIALDGVVSVVSQGARPIGQDFVVTAATGNVVVELAGKPAAEQLHAVLAGLTPDDLQLARQGLMAGLVIDETRPNYDVGDFLVRGLLGVESDTGGLAVAAEPRVGQTFRFHVRDADSADQDLHRALTAVTAPAAALLFACNGRGTQMFDEPNHDAGVVDDILAVPMAGAFCQGEIGPVLRQNHVHAFTATMIVFPA